VGGHEGYSGMPLWKIQQQNAAHREAALQESLAYAAKRTEPVIPPNILAEAVSVGGPPGGKPLARHVLIKCLRKVAQNSRVDLPDTGLFQNQAPIGLYCLFDGQSCAGEPGPAASEYCARNFYKKVLENLASLPAGCTSETFVKAALVKSFEDLDKDLLESQPDVRDGCGAAVALLLGEYLFTAVLGTCDAILCEASEGSSSSTASSLGRTQGRCHLPEERARLLRGGGVVVGEGVAARVVSPTGSCAVSRSLGDPMWKPVLSCIPEIQSVKLSWADKHRFCLLATKPIAEAMEPQELVDVAAGFPAQPRAACGELAAQATAKGLLTKDQGTIVEVWLLPGGPSAGLVTAEEEAEAAPRKKAKTVGGLPAPGGETKSARLRHILIRFQDGRPVPDSRKQTTRTRAEAEALLRQLLREFRIEFEELRRKHSKLKKPEEVALKSEKFLKLCKEHSVCPTAQKGGTMCGDLGWVTREAQRKMSKEFQEAVSVLRPGDWSDIVASQEGLHIVQRIA